MSRHARLRNSLLLLLSALTLTLCVASSASAAPLELKEAPVINGKAMVGHVLKVTNGKFESSEEIKYRYTWFVCASGREECESIPGANENEYKIPKADEGKFLLAVVRAFSGCHEVDEEEGGGEECSEEASSQSSNSPGPIEEERAEEERTEAPENTAAPEISGEARSGETLEVSNGEWTGEPESYTYQWWGCNSEGNECLEISGATANTLALNSGNLKEELYAEVTAHNTSGETSDSSSKVGPVGGPGIKLKEAPVINGEAKVGKVLEVTNGNFESSKEISYSYEWIACNSATAECEGIPNAESATYKIAKTYEGKFIRAFVEARLSCTEEEECSGSEAYSSNSAGPVEERTAEAPVNTAPPFISGEAKVGQPLTTSNGEWESNEEITYTYRWEACNISEEEGAECFTVPGAEGTEFTPTKEYVNDILYAEVTATNGTGSTSKTTYPSRPVQPQYNPKATTKPTISGEDKVGETLKGTTGTWEGGEEITFRYQWVRCGTEEEECNTITGANASEYTLTEEDLGKTIFLEVTAINNEGGYGRAESEPTGAVEEGGEAPKNTTAPEISGEAKVGKTLTSSTGTWTEEPESYTYQWWGCNSEGNECEEIAGATEKTLELKKEDTHKKILIFVTAHNTGGAATATSNKVGPVINPLPDNTTAPGVTGETIVGKTLTSSTGTWTGEPESYSYTWWRCSKPPVFKAITPARGRGPRGCEEITGEHSSTLVLTNEDLGDNILSEVIAANEGGEEWEFSNVVGPVTTNALHNNARPVISGEPVVGKTLSASTGSWSGEEPITYTYQWELCNTLGECGAVAGATSSTFQPGAADKGGTMRVTVRAENPEGPESATSGPVGPIVAPETSGETPTEKPVEKPTETKCTPPATGTYPNCETKETQTLCPATTASIDAALRNAVLPVGKYAKRAGLLKNNGYTTTFDAACAGSLKLEWVVASAHGRRKVAVASSSVTSAYKIKLTIKLTSAGRELLTAHNHLGLTAFGDFTPDKQGRDSIAKNFFINR